jgi:hypothetical protein
MRAKALRTKAGTGSALQHLETPAYECGCAVDLVLPAEKNSSPFARSVSALTND